MSNLDLHRLRWLASAALALSLSACVSSTAEPYTGPVYPAQAPQPPQPKPTPQVVYRIDDHRYFELTPDETCFGNMLYFIDTAKGIRSEVVKFDAVMNRTTLIIDAANDQYLVAPVTRGGNTNCSSGGGACGGNKLPYSTDGGRTWQLTWAYSYDDGLMVSGATAYNLDGTKLTHALDLTLPRPQSNDWRYLANFVFKPRMAPADTKVWCTAKPGENK